MPRKDRFDHGDDEPSDIGDQKPEPEFIGQSFSTSGDAPDYDYTYGDYPSDQTGPEIPTEIGSRIFPGKTTSTKLDDDGMYKVQLWSRGLESEGSIEDVKQLQIESDVGVTDNDIPLGTWVLVASNTYQKDVKDENSEIITEYTMQVPVWL